MYPYLYFSSQLYVHRSGRSVRGISAEGTSVLLVSPSEHYFYDKIRNTLGKSKSCCFSSRKCILQVLIKMVRFSAEKIPSYEISRPEIFATSKRLVDIGKKIDQLETKVKSVQSNASWMEKCAKEMDIILDEDEMYVFRKIP